jgi:hypothetical protein
MIGRRTAQLRGMLILVLILAPVCTYAADPGSTPPNTASDTSLARFIGAIRNKAKNLETSTGMRLSFRSFATAYKIRPESINYSDYVKARLLYEVARDAGPWNLHWTITFGRPKEHP